jgi:hypothetical protein
MLRGSTQAGSPELQRVVDNLLQEEYRAKIGERRDASRKPMARPLTIVPRDDVNGKVNAFSRDVSVHGIGVIGANPFPSGMVAKIHIEGCSGESAVMLAECRWCNPYGRGWFLSGWNFLALQRG